MKRTWALRLLTLLISLFIPQMLCGCRAQYLNSTSTASPEDTLSASEASSFNTDEQIRKATHKNATFQYLLVNGEAHIVFAEGLDDSYVIPWYIEGFPVTVIMSNAFYQKTNCTSICLPGTLRVIEEAAFYRCYSLEEIAIPASVEQIGDGAFFRTISLRKFIVDKNNKFYCDKDGVLYSADMKTLVAYPEGKPDEVYCFPETVSEMNSMAFGYQPNVKKIVIHSGVVSFPPMGLAVMDQDVTIVAEAGSPAEAYAKQWGYQE